MDPPIGIRLGKDLLRRLAEIAGKHRLTRTQVVQTMLYAGITQYERTGSIGYTSQSPLVNIIESEVLGREISRLAQNGGVSPHTLVIEAVVAYRKILEHEKTETTTTSP